MFILDHGKNLFVFSFVLGLIFSSFSSTGFASPPACPSPFFVPDAANFSGSGCEIAGTGTGAGTITAKGQSAAPNCNGAKTDATIKLSVCIATAQSKCNASRAFHYKLVTGNPNPDPACSTTQNTMSFTIRQDFICCRSQAAAAPDMFGD